MQASTSATRSHGSCSGSRAFCRWGTATNVMTMSATIVSRRSWRPHCSGCRRRSADEAITRALAAVGLQRGVDRAFYYELDEIAGALALTHEWHAAHLRAMKGLPQFARMPLADPAAAVPRQPAPRRNGAGAAHAPVSGHARRAAGRARGRSRAGADAGGRGGRADRHRRLRRRRRRDLGTGRHGSAAAGGARRGAHGRAQACRRRAAGGRGPLPRDVRRVAAGHLPGRDERRRPVPEPRRPAHHRPQRRGDGRTRLDQRASPRGPRARRRPLGHARSRRATGTRRRCIASSTRTATCVRSRCARSRSPASPTASACSASSRTSPTACAPRENARTCWRAPRRRASRPRRSRQEAEAARADVAAILSRISDAFIALDLDGRFTYANDRAHGAVRAQARAR